MEENLQKSRTGIPCRYTSWGKPLTFKVEGWRALTAWLSDAYIPQDGWTNYFWAVIPALFSSSQEAERGQCAAPRSSRASKHVAAQSLGPPANVLRWFLQCVVIKFECLVTFSWTPSQQASQRLWSGFHEPEKSNVDAEMLWHGYFHESTVERSVCRPVFLAFTLLLILLAMQHSRCTPKIMHTPSKVSDTFCLPRCPCLAQLEDPHALRT
jgi:hypothetical protein